MSDSRDRAMIHAAAVELRNAKSCLVGVGLPNRAALRACRMYPPGPMLVYESGAIGAQPTRLPQSVGDEELAETALTVVPMTELFNYWVQPGRIEVALVTAAQINRRGQLNSTVIGDYGHPKVRLPGTGGASIITTRCRKTVVVMRHERRAFVDEVDFVSSWALPPMIVVTDLCVMRLDPSQGELRLLRRHEGVELEEIRAATGWALLGAS